MNEGAAFLVDHVLGETPIRHWELSLPPPLRYLLAYDTSLASAVLGAFLHSVFQFLRWKAKESFGLRSISLAMPGAVTVIQRASSHLALNIHFHSLVTDGEAGNGWKMLMFALHSNLALLVLGPRQKVRERLSGRLADVLTNLYMAAAVLWRHEVDGRRDEELPMVNWCLESAFLRMNLAFDGILANYRVPVLGWLLAGPVRFCHWMNPLAAGPDDRLGAQVVQNLQTHAELRDRLTEPAFTPRDVEDPHSVLERAYERTVRTAAIEGRIFDAQTTGSLPRELEGEALF